MKKPATWLLHEKLKLPTHLQGERGSIIISAVIFAAIMGIAIGFSSIYISDRVKQTRGTAEKMDARVVLDSVLAYTTNGIKQTWCFSASWMQDAMCDLNHPRNTERLLLSDEALTYIAATNTPRPDPVINTRLTLITQTVSLNSITPDHPLSLILKPLRDKYQSVAISISRESSAIQTTKGREVPLRISITLTPKVITADVRVLELSSKVFVYPREVSYFALLVPKDLNLGVASAKPGDNNLDSVDIGAGTGLRFESPVFVNDNVNLPPPGASMRNVTFVDKIYLGGGFLRQNGKMFYPKSAGGPQSRYNHEMPNFKGILAGYELDIERDEGLDYLFNLQTAPALDDAAFNLCKSRLAAAFDLKETELAGLYTKILAKGFNTFDLLTSVGRVDNLVEQRHPKNDAFKIFTDVPGVTNAGNITRSGGTVFRVKVIYEGLQDPVDSTKSSDFRTEFFASRSTKATLYPLGNTGATVPRIDIETSPRVIGANSQFNEVNFKINFTNVNNLKLGAAGSSGATARIPSVRVVLEAMDYAYKDLKNLRGDNPPKETTFKTNAFVFEKNDPNSGTIELKNGTPGIWYADSSMDGSKPIDPNHMPDDRDYIAFDEKCFASPDDGDSFYMSFGASDWSESFVTQSRRAWSFTTDFVDGYLPGTLVIDGTTNSYPAAFGKDPVFQIKSLVQNCVITPTANFVAGFYTCERLTIQPRSRPLRMIGTFIVGKLDIDASAYKAGIRWSTIYHPSATAELRAAGVLGKLNDGTSVSCDQTLPPLWMPNVGVKTILAHFACNPVSLRKADPFKWTTVDPDCALDESVGKVKCKKHLTKFMIKEISRSGSL
ncbi:hypothetical protein D3C87_109560 [compost metagenome]